VAAQAVISSAMDHCPPGNCGAIVRDPPGWDHAFTLLELVTVIAIVGILLSIALPSYRSYLLRVHRSEAVHSLLEIAGCQERVFAMHGRYDTTRCLDLDLDHYAIRMEPLEESETLVFTAWADPIGSQQADRCGSLGLDQSGLRQVSGEGADPGKCWRASAL
jgi:type IV pilus assembly protein PilE